MPLVLPDVLELQLVELLEKYVRKRASAIDVPLLEYLLLYLRITTNKIVKTLCTRLGSVSREGQVMV